MYLRQQNKCYPKGIYLPISKLLSIITVANLLKFIYNNMRSNLLLRSNFITEYCSSELQFFNYLTPLRGIIYFACDGTYNGTSRENLVKLQVLISLNHWN